jgi:glycosyltransferase involved in cell wall biosynthesis
MKVLLINKFLYPKGGDAVSTLATGRLLVEKGWEVVFWGMDSPETPDYPYKGLFVSNVNYTNGQNVLRQAKDALRIIYSFEARRKLGRLLDECRPDIVHLNNFAHQISPSVLDAIKRRGIPAVMTMRDYKMVCPSYSMLAHGMPCERCREGRYYHCLFNRCTKDSALKSLVNTVEMYVHHRMLHIYDKMDTYISPSRFLQEKVREMGLRGEIVYLPNFVDVEKFIPSYEGEEESIIYVGRLSHEKGIATLMDAVKDSRVTLKVIGDGPLKKELVSKVQEERIDNVVFLGYKTGRELHDEIRKSLFLVIPSEWYENNPRTVIEAFALGKPVIGARIGGIPELVKDWETGLTFTSGDARDLREKIEQLLDNPEKIPEMGRKARALVERELNPEIHYRSLLSIYERAIHKSEGK